MTEDGGGLTTTVTIPAGGRTNIWPTAGLPAFSALANRRFATFLESTGGEPFVAERAMYLFTDFSSGHVNMGTPWTGTIAAPSRPPGTVTVSGFTPAQMRLSGGEAITITGSGFIGTPEVTVDGLPTTITCRQRVVDHGSRAVAYGRDRVRLADRSRLRLTTSGKTQTIGNIGRVFRVIAIGDSFTEGQLVERHSTGAAGHDADADLLLCQPALSRGPRGPAQGRRALRQQRRRGQRGLLGRVRVDQRMLGQPDQWRGIASAAGHREEVRRRDHPRGLQRPERGRQRSARTIDGLRTMGRTAQASGATVLMGRIHVMRADM